MDKDKLIVFVSDDGEEIVINKKPDSGDIEDADYNHRDYGDECQCKQCQSK